MELPMNFGSARDLGVDVDHPDKALSIPLILDAIFSFLPIPDLSRSAQVNKLWNQLASKIIPKRELNLVLSHPPEGWGDAQDEDRVDSDLKLFASRLASLRDPKLPPSIRLYLTNWDAVDPANVSLVIETIHKIAPLVKTLRVNLDFNLAKLYGPFNPAQVGTIMSSLSKYVLTLKINAEITSQREGMFIWEMLEEAFASWKKFPCVTNFELGSRAGPLGWGEYVCHQTTLRVLPMVPNIRQISCISPYPDHSFMMIVALCGYGLPPITGINLLCGCVDYCRTLYRLTCPNVTPPLARIKLRYDPVQVPNVTKLLQQASQTLEELFLSVSLNPEIRGSGQAWKIMKLFPMPRLQLIEMDVDGNCRHGPKLKMAPSHGKSYDEVYPSLTKIRLNLGSSGVLPCLKEMFWDEGATLSKLEEVCAPHSKESVQDADPGEWEWFVNTFPNAKWVEDTRLGNKEQSTSFFK